MEFSRRKLPASAADKLISVSISKVQPFALMLAPVYVFLKRNEKFVSVKAPLDFFTPKELEQLATYENFYVDPCVEQTIPYRDAANRIKSLLKWHPQKTNPAENKSKFPVKALPPAPFEISDAVIRIIGPLWNDQLEIEPYFVALFATELCEPIDTKYLTRARDQDLKLYELALVKSGWSVFLALHLGICEIGFLNRLRIAVFKKEAFNLSHEFSKEIDQLIEVANTSMSAIETKLSSKNFESQLDRVSQRLVRRLKRIKEEFAGQLKFYPSIFGPGGFIDV